MTKSKTRKDYDYYTMNIPNELRILYEVYIAKHPNLGFKNVSQYFLHLLQLRAAEIIKENPDLRKIKEFKTGSVRYVLQDDGTYKKLIDKKKLLEEIDHMWEPKSSNNRELRKEGKTDKNLNTP